MAEPRIPSQIVLVRHDFEAAVQRLLHQPRLIAWGRAGVNRTPHLTELIVRNLIPMNAMTAPPAPTAVLLALNRGTTAPVQPALIAQRWWDFHRAPARLAAVLVLEPAPRRGHLEALLFSSDGEIVPVQLIKLLGPGLPRIRLLNGQSGMPSAAPLPSDRERWSRLIGALGEETWQRLRTLRICLIGVGRTGSLIATSLARSGVTAMTLCDGDRLERHNLDAMNGVTEHDVGKLKVDAVRASLLAINDAMEVGLVPSSITALNAFIHAKEADVLISCVDQDSARMAVGIIAALYQKPWLEIGSGIREHADQRHMGADVRLILPGRCLLCFGGVANLDHARELFTRSDTSPSAPVPWHEERAGSLRSLNQVAAGLGLRLLEDFIGEYVQQSTWRHCEFDPHGVFRTQDVHPPENPTCPLCRHAGMGDDGLSLLREVLPVGLMPDEERIPLR